jgi:hypothetical protein
MEPRNIVAWKQTTAGMWIRVPDQELTIPKRPARKIASLMAKQAQPGPIRQASKRPILTALRAPARI